MIGEWPLKSLIGTSLYTCILSGFKWKKQNTHTREINSSSHKKRGIAMILFEADGAEHRRISSLLKRVKSLSRSCLKQTHVEENVNMLRQSGSNSTPSNRVVFLSRRELTCEAENLLRQPTFSECRADFSTCRATLILHKQKIIKMLISQSICKHVVLLAQCLSFYHVWLCH